ncbi:hypothetical protein BATDEDRAFT_26928 [Batrachochytrium dendrobatidis JAM81]|uniref:5'-deoxynucleotidase n=1 Tax=Batrachochytrium dendrobatidis (strain JAM81 / FGSC 10211) TaxID=684364 RepID=F4P9J9_BATDJ|nr:uncharacterized protein BATDEDRAFT_26928 [Batrachochytrium dendrobatidis JAM81]EGF78332.1 hypothetical protein BATDEDRAFT_26928 [Batrachochytrium dendrobatidis JAM81]|eukprot:XP_006681092.1 hypothetical protein BATDEDRAFT_26928 [Batrachochytrium dendrobatidis JAM81]
MLRFLHTCENLKTTKRTGWVDKEIPGAESIGDHMHRMSIIAMLIKDPTMDKNRLIKMAIVHDLAEAVVGDITPYSGVSKKDKQQRERDAMALFVENQGRSSEILEIQALWEEYEAGSTKEALLCKDIDKATLEYEKRTGKRLQSFFDFTKGKFMHPEIRAMVDDLYKERETDLGFSC